MPLKVGRIEFKLRSKARNYNCAEPEQYIKDIIIRKLIQKNQKNFEFQHIKISALSIFHKELWKKLNMSVIRKLDFE